MDSPTKLHCPVLDHGYVKYIDHMGTDLTPVEAARMSTNKESGVDVGKDDELRDYLWRNSHSTPFEMCELVIEVQCPIFVARQWIRHRVFSYNELSGRYTQMPNLFYVPERSRVKGKGKLDKQGSEGVLTSSVITDFIAHVKEGQQIARDDYNDWNNANIANELARINLPLAQYTRFRAKGNLRNWFHFLELRLDSHAQYEIRVYAEAIAQIIKNLWPKCWTVFEEHTLDAITLSKTEIMLLREIIRDWAFGDDGATVSYTLRQWLENADVGLTPGRQREFLTKLGISSENI